MQSPGKNNRTTRDYVEKISDTLYIHHISKKTEDKWKNQRRKKDELDSFKNIDGFHLKEDGRSGTIYYIKRPDIVEYYYEFSGVPKYDILINFNGKNSWDLPAEKPMGSTVKKEIKKELLQWLKEKKIRAQL